jgi:hypothetical protein
MIRGVVGARVPWPQDPREDLASTGGEQRIEPEPALVMAGRVFLLGVDRDRCRVEIEDHTLGSRARLPRPPASDRTRLSDQIKLCLSDREQHPPRRRDRRDITEQRRLTGRHSEVRNTSPTVRCHHRQIAQHTPGIMARAPLTSASERGTQTINQPESLRHERQQRAAHARGQTCAVRDDIYRVDR